MKKPTCKKVDKELAFSMMGIASEFKKTMKKPICKLLGEDGNVFNLIGLASRTLKKSGLNDKAKEMSDKCFQSKSYDEVLSIIMDYVEVR